MSTETDDLLDVNAHCLECPGTGWLWGTKKCFDQYGRVRACFVRDPGHRNGTLRPPLAPLPVAPAPVPIATVKAPRPLEPVPMALDLADVPGQVRAWYVRGVSPRLIAVRLNRCTGSHWYASTVRALIREQAPAKKVAA
jgi:hypothetical protein